MRVVITGSAGFLGRWFVRELQQRGADIIGLDLIRTPELTLTEQIVGDLRETLPRFRRSCDLFIHLAAYVGGREQIDGNPLRIAYENQQLDAMAWEYAYERRPGRVLYVSSSAVYPVALQGADALPLGEQEQPYTVQALGTQSYGEPDQTYGWTKLLGERTARTAQHAGLPVTVVRPFSGYAADQDDCYPYRAFLDRARARKAPFEIWGSADQVRDWIHASDVVAGALKLAELGVHGPTNLCTGVGTSMRDLARLMTAAAAYSPELSILPDAPMGVRARVGNPRRMLQYYVPQVALEQQVLADVRGVS